jgi:hypothetical protein
MGYVMMWTNKLKINPDPIELVFSLPAVYNLRRARK